MLTAKEAYEKYKEKWIDPALKDITEHILKIAEKGECCCTLHKGNVLYDEMRISGVRKEIENLGFYVAHYSRGYDDSTYFEIDWRP